MNVSHFVLKFLAITKKITKIGDTYLTHTVNIIHSPQFSRYFDYGGKVCFILSKISQ